MAYAFARPGQGEIRVGLRRLGGRLFVDVRLWVRVAGAPDVVPTRKGVSFPADDLPRLTTGLAAVAAGIRTLDLASARSELGDENVD